MKTFLLTLLGLTLGYWLDDPLTFAVLGFLLGRVLELEQARRVLERQVARLQTDWDAPRPGDARAAIADAGTRKPADIRSSGDAAIPDIDTRTATDLRSPPPGVPLTASPTADAALGSSADPLAGMEPPPDRAKQSRTPAPVDHESRSGDRTPSTASWRSASPRTGAPPSPPDWFRPLRDWFRGGNLFVRIGILLVFFGVGFLLKYAVDQRWLSFTLEMRLAAIALAGLALLILGWSLRARRRDYALLLQGAGLGILALDVYGAYQLHALIGATPAFALLTAIALTAALLALLQDAPPLAWFGFAGGFLAPLLTATGSSGFAVLLGYYALLDAAILAVAWFKRWRALRLLGFGFTFGVILIRVALDYNASEFAVLTGFVAFFFMLFAAIQALDALGRPPPTRGHLDATLLFGTPLLTFSAMIGIAGHLEYGIASSALAMGAVYALLAAWLARAAGVAADDPSLQAFRALAIVLPTAAIPFAVAAQTTAGLWALEGAAMVWLGRRQQRLGLHLWGLLLQAGAALAILAAEPVGMAPPFLNGLHLGALLVGLSAILSAWWLERPAAAGAKRPAPGGGAPWRLAAVDAKQPVLGGGAPWLLSWGLVWWFGAGLLELDRVLAPGQLPAGILIHALASALIAAAVLERRPWPRLDPALAALPPLAGLLAFALALERLDHPGASGGLLAWPLFALAIGVVLYRIEGRGRLPVLTWSQAVLGLLVLSVAQWELVWQLIERHGWTSGWAVAAPALLPALALALLARLPVWPLTTWRRVHGGLIGGLLALFLTGWAFWSAAAPGDADPWPWLPLLNPPDAMLLLTLLALWRWRFDLRRRGLLVAAGGLGEGTTDRLLAILTGVLALLWINLLLLRTIHQLWGIPYRFSDLFGSDLVQMALSVLWSLVGVGLLLAARWRASRGLWFAAALLLALTVVKLFAIDLAASGTLERIVSFLVVGGLLMGIGWLSPLPPRGASPAHPNGQDTPSAPDARNDRQTPNAPDARNGQNNPNAPDAPDARNGPDGPSAPDGQDNPNAPEAARA